MRRSRAGVAGKERGQRSLGPKVERDYGCEEQAAAERLQKVVKGKRVRIEGQSVISNCPNVQERLGSCT